MKTLLLILCFALATAVQAADSRPDLKLMDGTVLKRARIVSIKNDVAIVVHAGGTTNVPADQIEVASLLEAQREIADSTAAAQQRTAAAAKQSEASNAAAREAARAREAFTADDLAAKKLAAANIGPDRARNVSLQKLKSDFPPKSSGSVRVLVKSHYDTIQFTVPSDDVWSWYRGTFQTATIESLPRTLELVRKRIDDDMAKLGHIGSGKAARVQAEQTQQWLQRTLLPYMAQWRSLMK